MHWRPDCSKVAHRECLKLAVPLLSWMHAQEFEKTLDGWMAEFHMLLTYDNPSLAETDPERESPVEAAKAAVCQNVNLFLEACRVPVMAC